LICHKKCRGCKWRNLYKLSRTWQLWFETRWGKEIFSSPRLTTPALRHKQLPIQCGPGLFTGGKTSGAWSWTPSPI